MRNKIFRKIFQKYNYFTLYFSISESEKCITKQHIPACPPPILADIRNVRKDVLIIGYMCSLSQPQGEIHVAAWISET